ncbi:complement receptor type 2-like isoform X2 [Embiotoca jacksoni]|uniref:complement receptor type 2-like isoform X2 n=1 Tax=Embiotoca jacksoni TaxID=100190 RepID=UPI0037046AF1
MKTVGWSILVSSFALLASAQPKKCSAPVEYPHTSMVKTFTSRQEFNSGDKFYYKCAEDFTPTKGSRAVQCLDGKWTKLTLKCEKITCGNAGDLPNGQFKYGESTFIGEKVYAICNEGYTLKGLNYMICKRSGWTGEFLSCEEGETTCSTPAVANSVQRGGDVAVHRVGDSVSFSCSRGFQLDGAQQITCGSGGQWQPQPPRCLPSPDKTQQSSGNKSGCGVPLTVYNSNANLVDKYITRTSFSSADKVYYVCDVGYTAAGGSRTRLCNNGEWTPLTLKCERRLCGSAGEILNGQFIYSGVAFGDTAKAVCDEGYILVGRATRNCMSNGWGGRIPVCEAMTCEEPPAETNAEMESLQEPPYLYRRVIRYHCRVGTLIGQKELWCTKSGMWSAPPPKCKEITCPSPNVTNGYWRRAHNEIYHYKDMISIKCDSGYAMTGWRTATCNHDGQWVPGLPKCQRTNVAPRRSYYTN